MGVPHTILLTSKWDRGKNKRFTKAFSETTQIGMSRAGGGRSD